MFVFNNKMVYENEFVARFYSNDSIDKFSNSLSAFTTEFDTPIDFGDEEFEIGVCQMFLNPCLSSNIIKKASRDFITMQWIDPPAPPAPPPSESHTTGGDKQRSTGKGSARGGGGRGRTARDADVPSPLEDASAESHIKKKDAPDSSVDVDADEEKKKNAKKRRKNGLEPPGVNEYDVEEFARFTLHHSLDPSMYTPDYFHKYLDEGLFYDPIVLDTFFASDNLIVTEDERSRYLTVTVDIEILLEKDEKLEAFLMEHQTTSEVDKKKYADMHLFVFTKTQTMNQILNRMLKYLIFALRDVTVSPLPSAAIDLHARHFFNNNTRRLSFEKFNEARRKHLESTNILVTRFIKKFVQMIREEQKKMKVDKVLERRFLHLYCDAIQPQITGAKMTRLLFTMPFDGSHSVEFTHERLEQIQYAKLEKSKLKNISFLFLDEFGERIPFASSYHANHIAIKFRRIRK